MKAPTDESTIGYGEAGYSGWATVSTGEIAWRGYDSPDAFAVGEDRASVASLRSPSRTAPAPE